jgi:hypothetical protein
MENMETAEKNVKTADAMTTSGNKRGQVAHYYKTNER